MGGIHQVDHGYLSDQWKFYILVGKPRHQTHPFSVSKFNFFLLTLCLPFLGQHSLFAQAEEGRNLVGCVSGNCQNGEGVSRNSSGSLYEGTFENGKFEGTGKMTYRDGDIYEGEFSKGKMHGPGKYTYADGQTYVGDFSNGKMQGEGELEYTSGNRYKGSFKNNMKSGEGAFWFNDSSRYEGEFAFDKMDGKGLWYYSNGDKYEGEFAKGKQNGQGAYYYLDGNRYEGSFVSGNFHGKGTLLLKDGSYYEGDFKADNLNGFGIFYYASGDVYAGQFENGNYEGCGTYYYANGDKYVGDYRTNLSHGTGTYYEAEGEATRYHYIKGEIVGEGTQLAYSVTRRATKLTPEATPKEIKAEPLKTTPVEKVENTPVQVATPPSDKGSVSQPMANAETKSTSCPACSGKGKLYQSEVRKNKMVTKDISNGMGPRNFVTYSVNEIVKPAGFVGCGRCGGIGKVKNE